MNKYITVLFFLFSKVTYAYDIKDLLFKYKSNLDLQVGSLHDDVYPPGKDDNIINSDHNFKNQIIILAKLRLSWKIFDPWMELNIDHWESSLKKEDIYEKKIKKTNVEINDIHLVNWFLNKKNYNLGITGGCRNKPLTWHTDHSEIISIPYIGFLWQIFYNNFAFDGTVRWSNQRYSLSNKNYLKDKTNNPKKYYYLGLNLAYFFTSNLKFYTSFFWDQYNKPQAYSTNSKILKEEYHYLKTSSIFAIGLKYNF